MKEPSALAAGEVPAVARTPTDAILVEPNFVEQTFHCPFVVVASYGFHLRLAPFSSVEKAVASHCGAPQACCLVTEFAPESRLTSLHLVDHAPHALCVVFPLRPQPLALCENNKVYYFAIWTAPVNAMTKCLAVEHRL